MTFEKAPIDRKDFARAMHGGEQEAGDESEMVDKETKLRLIGRPMRGTVERHAEK